MFKKIIFSADRAYVAPLCETLDVKAEGIVCLSANWSENPGGAGGNDNYQDGPNL